MKKTLSILALSLSLVATAASARFCPSASFIQNKTYLLSISQGTTQYFESTDKTAVVFIKKGTSLKDALKDIKSVSHIEFGHCIYKGNLVSNPPVLWPSSLPTVVYL